ncbi:hypothetical protein JX266_013988 [Neoarthrinium moseri]|nr:hypothetical protein JX266_013988 [Neoarthrinium moseri]
MGPSVACPPRSPPFVLDHELHTGLDGSAHAAQSIPGYPNVPLHDRSRVYDFLARDLCSTDLDHMADKLWWMSKQDSSSISPLHRQLVKRRTIVVTEDPKLHLVWIHDRIFVKPLPRYIASHAFWHDFLCGDHGAEGQPEHIYRTALGFLRSYGYLIQYESDFRIARDASLCLIPQNITWEQFCNFISALADVKDRDVSPRYGFGEIRLTRLNLYAPLLLRKSHFQRVEYQYGAYFAQFYGPVLFVIGITSVVLSAMQVCVAVEQAQGGPSVSNLAFWFGLVMIVIFLLVCTAFCSIWILKVAKEWRVAIRDRRRLLEEGRGGLRSHIA